MRFLSETATIPFKKNIKHNNQGFSSHKLTRLLRSLCLSMPLSASLPTSLSPSQRLSLISLISLHLFNLSASRRPSNGAAMRVTRRSPSSFKRSSDATKPVSLRTVQRRSSSSFERSSDATKPLSTFASRVRRDQSVRPLPFDHYHRPLQRRDQ